MAGWDDDDHLLDAMLHEEDEAVGNVSIVATGADNTKAHGGDGGDAVDDDDDAVAAGGGWDDDDLDLDGLSSSDDNERNDDIAGTEEGMRGAAIQPPLPQQLRRVVSPPGDGDILRLPLSSPPPHGNNDLDATMETTFATLREHEDLMEREIEIIRNDESFAQGHQRAVAGSDGADAEEEWDFDEDDDIFNEQNCALGVEDDRDDRVMPEKALTVSLDPALMPAQPLLSMVPPPATAHPIPPQENQLQHQQLSENPEEENPKLISAAKSNCNNIVDETSHHDCDGWSDEDFFDDDDDDDILSSSKPKATVPPSSPTPPSKVLTPPVAQISQANTAPSQDQKQQQKLWPVVQPKLPCSVPAVQQTDVVALNPTQRRLHRMLSSYITSLHDSDFLTRLHQKLHLSRQTPSSGTGGDGCGGSAANAAGDLRTYYAARPGLRKYTLGVELDRMSYELKWVNGKSTKDKDVIREYFGVGEDGERLHHHNDEGGAGGGLEGGETATTEELLIRSANQSLLADMLAALTGPEEDIATAEGSGSSADDFFDQDGGRAGSAGLILSGPTLCMTSVAEACRFTVDMQCGKVEAICLLAVSVPFHPMVDASAASGTDTSMVEDGRLVLARAEVSARFRPGGEGGDFNDEPTVQYAVQSLTPSLSPESTMLRQAAISLARDQHDPFFQNEHVEDDAIGTDARDRFLLSHHLLSAADSAALLAVSRDHIDKLRDAAEKGSTGFRSALRQLDGVTNVSARLEGLSGGFGLALPSAADIEAAEREAVGCAYAPSTQLGAEIRFPRAHDVADEDPFRFPRAHDLPTNNVRNAHPRPLVPPPPPLPPPVPSQVEASETAASRPRPLIGGLFMSGLSRLAAAATQPDDQQQQSSWRGVSGGTGLTPPNSPPSANGIDRNEHNSLYPKEENEGLPSSGMQEYTDEPRGYTGLTPLAAKQLTRNMDHFQAGMNENDIDEVGKGGGGLLEGEQDVGWSDEEFDFEDEKSSDHFDDLKEKEACSKDEETELKKQGANPPDMDGVKLAPVCEANESKEETIPITKERHQSLIPEKAAAELHQHFNLLPGDTEAVVPTTPQPPHPPYQKQSSNQQHHTFDEEFVIVLKEKIEAECREIKKTGRVKRWQPLREDVVFRRRLMEVMVSQINS